MFYNLRRRLSTALDRTLYRVGYREVREALDRLGVRAGSALCVHSALRSLGHLPDGPKPIVDALQDAVGPGGAVLMPTFTFSGSMLARVDEGGTFDVKATPSQVGFLTEFFRKQDGVRRSLHPTHAVAGWGERAGHFLHGHEMSETPFGAQTPYGRLAEDDDAYMLMLETRLLSLGHHLQERVDYPNLFLPGTRTLEYVDATGRQGSMQTRVMRPEIPYFLAIPAAAGDEPAWCDLRDFCLVFPRWRVRELREAGCRLDGYPAILSRRAALERSGLLRTTRLGRGEIGLLAAKPFIRAVEPELRALLARYAGQYAIDNVKRKTGVT